MGVGKTLAINGPGLPDDINKMAGWGLAAARPATGDVLAGSFYFSTDTNVLEQEQNGSWVAILQTKTLSPANETVEAGYYAATTLSAVDTDLAVGNIKDGVNIFGFAGTYGALTIALAPTSKVDVWAQSAYADVYSVSIPANAKRIFAMFTAWNNILVDNTAYVRIFYDGVEKVSASGNSRPATDPPPCRVGWTGDGVGSIADLKLQAYATSNLGRDSSAVIWYTT